MGLSNIQLYSVYERGRERDEDGLERSEDEKQVLMAKRGASVMASMLGNELRDSRHQNKTNSVIELTLRVQTPHCFPFAILTTPSNPWGVCSRRSRSIRR